MKQIEENVMHSFRLAKSDIIKLQNEVVMLSQTQERVMEMVDELKSYEQKLYQYIKEVSKRYATNPKTIIKTIRTRPKTVIKTITNKPKKIFVASKEGKDFHMPKCPFAQNIKPKSKKVFKSKSSALNKGYKACKCVK